jgi:hypothetical protein
VEKSSKCQQCEQGSSGIKGRGPHPLRLDRPTIGLDTVLRCAIAFTMIRIPCPTSTVEEYRRAKGFGKLRFGVCLLLFYNKSINYR